MLSINKKTFHIIIDCLFLVIILGVYFYFALDSLSEQGIHWDVALLGVKALGIYKSGSCEMAGFGPPQFICLFNRAFPLMNNEYHGPVEIYFSLPMLYLFGPTAFAFNIVPILFGAAVLFAFYILINLLYQSRVLAILLSLLLSSLPTFIAANRIGLFTGTLIMFFCLFSILSFLLWIKKGKFYWLSIAFLMLGFGMGSRCFFWWFLVAMTIFFGLFLREPFFRIKMLKLSQKIICLFSVSLGIVPIIIYNLWGNFPTLRFFLRYSILSANGISNLNYINNIGHRAMQLLAILEGNVYAGFVTCNKINVYIFIFSLLVSLITAISLFIKKRLMHKSLLFPLVVSLLVFLQSPLTPTNLAPHHIFYILPLILMITATAVSLNQNKYIMIILTFFLAIATAFSLRTNYLSLINQKAHLILAEGANGENEIRYNIGSDVIKWLKDNNIKRVGIGDPGIVICLLCLGGYDLDMEEIFYTDPFRIISTRGLKEEELRGRLRDEKEGYYLFRLYTHLFERFHDIAVEENKKVERAKEFKTPSPGRETVFIMYRVSNVAPEDTGS